MKIGWTVVERVGQQYYYNVEAESQQEAIEKVKRGLGGVARHTREMRPEYTANKY